MTIASELTGYPDRFSIAQGETVEFKISTDRATYGADIVRLIHGDRSGPGFKEEFVQSLGTFQGRSQRARAGSYGLIEGLEIPTDLASFTVQLWVRPTTPLKGRSQGLIAFGEGGLSLSLGPGGDCQVQLDPLCVDEIIKSGVPLAYNQWCFLAVTFDARRGTLDLHQRPSGRGQAPVRKVCVIVNPARSRTHGPVLLAATGLVGALGHEQAVGLFNGRIEAPCIFRRCLSDSELDALYKAADPREVASSDLIAYWDFAQAIEGSSIVDCGPSATHGVLVNAPARGVTGHLWDGSEYDFKRAPQEFSAVHFHDDDLEDACWETDLSWEVPTLARSGFYALRLKSDRLEDHIPFIVRPAAQGRRSKAVVLVPTMTYAAYANQTLQELEPYRAHFSDRVMQANEWDLYLADHPELGLSIYDAHSDGSPVFYSSLRRPIPNLRPQYRQWQFGTPRHLGADLYLIDWLEAKGYEYDVITDHDLHHGGYELLGQYRVFITGTHPEYWTTPMRVAVEAFQATGGRQMYLGGNGFFWVTSVNPERPYLIEVRKGPWGPTASADIEAERYHSTTGERGGLWRDRGKPPNQIVGIGTAAMGYDNIAPGYVRQPASFAPEVSFIFEGVGEDEVIGDFGLVLGGAAGDEIDRLDRTLETPPETLLLASAAGHGPTYFPVVSGFGELLDYTRSTTDKNSIRSDMVYCKHPSGGQVFSVGSISWCGSLSHNGHENNVSRITENVLRRFMEE